MADKPTAASPAQGVDNLDPLTPKRTFKSVQDVHEEMASIQAHAQTYYSQADNQGRGLTAPEVAVVQQHLDYHKWLETDEVPRMQLFEDAKRKSAEINLATTQRANEVSRRQGLTGGTPGAFPVTGYHGAHEPPRAIQKLKAFRAESYRGGAGEAEDAARDAGMWMKATLLNDRDAINYCRSRPELNLGNLREQAMDAQTVDDTAKGGILVPTVVSRTVLDVRDRVGIAAQECRRYPMQSEIDIVPKRAAGLTVYKPGEDTAITTSEKTFGSTTLTANDAYTLTYISQKLIRGSVVDAVDQVVNEIGYAFASQQDEESINGDGVAGAPHFGIEGIIPHIGTAGFTTTAPTSWALLTKAVIEELIGLLPDRFHDNAIFVCSRSFWAQAIEPILEVRAASVDDMATHSTRMLKGYRIAFSEKMATQAATDSVPLLLGSWTDSMLLGERANVGIAESLHHRFDFDQLAVRGKIGYDIQFHERGDASNPGGICGVKMGIVP